MATIKHRLQRLEDISRAVTHPPRVVVYFEDGRDQRYRDNHDGTFFDHRSGETFSPTTTIRVCHVEKGGNDAHTN